MTKRNSKERSQGIINEELQRRTKKRNNSEELHIYIYDEEEQQKLTIQKNSPKERMSKRNYEEDGHRIMKERTVQKIQRGRLKRMTCTVSDKAKL